MHDPATAAPRGTFFLVVGPSGAGKDTLIESARAKLAGDPRYVFARRAITRPAEAGGEQHEAMTQAAFAAARNAGAFALAWSAHGHDYGIPRSIADAQAAGRHVVANVSRAVLDEARRRFAPTVVVEVSAEPDILAERLAVRGRETAAEIAERLGRAAAVPVVGEDVVRIDNSGDVAQGVVAFLAVLQPA